MNVPTRHLGDTPLYPIREVSRLTGVNAVTLRAWERRYGLLQPRRTPKGHRLYAREDIERVERVVQWLSRGVPVSQVRELLDRPEATQAPPPDTGDWPDQRQRLMTAIETLDQECLEALFSHTLALYPVSLCLAELWQPTLQALEKRWDERPGDILQRRTLEAFLRTRIGIRLLHANRQAQGPRLLLASMPEEPSPLWGLLTALAASDRGCRVQWFDAPLPIAELSLAMQHFQAAALLLTGGQASRAEPIRRQLPRLAEQIGAPLALCGPVSRIHGAELADTRVVPLGDDLNQAMTQLQILLMAPAIEPEPEP